jgi:hypothetical protein
MTKPSVYILGGTPELSLIPTDQNGEFFTPTEMRLSIKEPSGEIFTVSGTDLAIASGYYYYDYKPDTIGWFEYEAWVKDSTGREIAQTNGFEIIDRVY